MQSITASAALRRTLLLLAAIVLFCGGGPLLMGGGPALAAENDPVSPPSLAPSPVPSPVPSLEPVPTVRAGWDAACTGVWVRSGEWAEGSRIEVRWYADPEVPALGTDGEVSFGANGEWSREVPAEVQGFDYRVLDASGAVLAKRVAVNRSCGAGAVLPPSVALARVDCDTALVSSTLEPRNGASPFFRIIDEAGRDVLSETFSGALKREVSLAPGHDYTAQIGYSDTDEALASSSPLDLRTACDVKVVADAPSIEDPCGTAHDVVQVPHVIGVDYLRDGAVLAPGPLAATGPVELTARAQTGYELGGEASWTRVLSDAPCPAGVEPSSRPDRPGASLTAPSTAPSSASGEQHAEAQAEGHAGETAPSTLPGLPFSAEAPAPTPSLDSPAADAAASASADRTALAQPFGGGPGVLQWSVMAVLALLGVSFLWYKSRH